MKLRWYHIDDGTRAENEAPFATRWDSKTGRTQVAGYIGLAHAYATIGKRDKSHEYAERGLSLLAEWRDGPGSKAIARGESRVIPPDIDDQIERQLRTYLEH